MRAQDRQEFVRQCNVLIQRCGGVQTPEKLHAWRLLTYWGPLGLTVRENAHNGPGSVFARFDHPELAAPETGCNPYSGKWNHHFFSGWTVEEAVTAFGRTLAKAIACRTLADHAEMWWLKQRHSLPDRGTPAWKAMYEQWAHWAFADFATGVHTP